MTRAAIHQLVPSFSSRDAIGGHTLQVQALLREHGFESEIYAMESKRELKGLSHHYRQLKATTAPTWLLYQCSTGSPLADWLLARPEPKLSNYHNITPAEFFEPWEPHVGAELDVARRQLADLAASTELAVCDSAYNEAELVGLGYRRTAVVPILLDTGQFERAVDTTRLGRLQDARVSGGADWLFVGRIAPNKCQHDIVKAFAAYRRIYDPKARLHLVGGSSSHRYLTAIEDYVDALGIGDAGDLAGSVSEGELSAHYRAADVFVCLSEHEGFCVPLLEAMHHRVPIVALGETAVPETLGGGGLVLDAKTPAFVAAAVHRVLEDGSLRQRLVSAGTARLADFDLARSKARFADAVEALVGDRV